jgi:adenosine deaminase
MGGRRESIQRLTGAKLSPFRAVDGTIGELDEWIATQYRPLLKQGAGVFALALKAAFRQAARDGVKVLEASIDAGYGAAFRIPPANLVSILRKVHQETAPEIDFRPELGLNRNHSIRLLLLLIEPYFEFNYFTGIDLYDDEMAQPIRNFREIYRFAHSLGLRCKAHAGEFGNADSVIEAVEELELDSVQHGIGAAGSIRAMQWLADHRIRLNVCPASNIRLKRCTSYKTHPIRRLFDQGIRVALGTDDVLIFGSGITEQIHRLLEAKVFTPEEMEVIRRNGMEVRR